MISIVVPVYGCPEALAELSERVRKVFDGLRNDYELILVNDKCPKNSWEVIQNLASNESNIIAVNLSRNFGQHYAITCGLTMAKGEWVVVMDCDLQDEPEEIANLYEKAIEGYDIVYACRDDRKDSFFKKLGSKCFYKFLSYMTDTKQDSRIANFGIYSRKSIDALLTLKESLRFFPVNIRWLGFNSSKLTVNHSERHTGGSGYNLKKLIQLATDVIISFSDKPLKLMVKAGFIVSFTAFLFTVYILGSWLIDGTTVEGWASIMVSLWFMFGISTCFLGIVGIYVAKAFDEGKRRPLFIIDQIIGAKK